MDRVFAAIAATVVTAVVLNVEAPPTLAREEDVLVMTDQQAEGYLRSLLLKNRQYALYCYRVIQSNNELAKE